MRPISHTADRIRRGLYRAQVCLGLTGPEGWALLAVSLALIAGLVLSEVQERRAVPLDPEAFYAASDAAFAAALVPPDSVLSDSVPTVKTARVPVNTATEAQLVALPGVGPVTAVRIVEARPFASAADLQRVQGIGPAKADRLAPLVSF